MKKILLIAISLTVQYAYTHPIFSAVKSNDISKVQALLEEFSSNILHLFETDHNLTPLHISVDEGLLEMTSVLLANGAPVNAQDNMGRTPLYYAVSRRNLSIVQVLVEHDAAALIATSFQDTPLRYAGKWNLFQIYQVLNGAVDIQSQGGGQVIHFPCKNHMRTL